MNALNLSDTAPPRSSTATTNSSKTAVMQNADVSAGSDTLPFPLSTRTEAKRRVHFHPVAHVVGNNPHTHAIYRPHPPSEAYRPHYLFNRTHPQYRPSPGGWVSDHPLADTSFHQDEQHYEKAALDPDCVTDWEDDDVEEVRRKVEEAEGREVVKRRWREWVRRVARGENEEVREGVRERESE